MKPIPTITSAAALFALAGLIAADADHLSASDDHGGFWRIACFTGARLEGVAYLSEAPVSVSRSWACEQLQKTFETPQSRWRVLAGRAADGMSDKGAIVCSCLSVGINEIAAAVRNGCHTADTVGKATRGGTGCGSCRAEITEIIHAHRLIAAE